MLPTSDAEKLTFDNFENATVIQLSCSAFFFAAKFLIGSSIAAESDFVVMKQVLS